MATAPIPLSLFPARVKFVNPDGTLTNEAYRALQSLLNRVGGPVSISITEVVADLTALNQEVSNINEDIAAIESDVGSIPVLPTNILPDALDPPLPSFSTVEALQSEVSELREIVAVLAAKINDINQGKL